MYLTFLVVVPKSSLVSGSLSIDSLINPALTVSISCATTPNIFVFAESAIKLKFLILTAFMSDHWEFASTIFSFNFISDNEP